MADRSARRIASTVAAVKFNYIKDMCLGGQGPASGQRLLLVVPEENGIGIVLPGQ